VAHVLSCTQLAALDHMARGESPASSVRGAAAAGGFNNTARSLIRLGYMTANYTITKAGRDALGLCVYCNGRGTSLGTGLTCHECGGSGKRGYPVLARRRRASRSGARS
jgi:hypothetical protein